MNPQSIVAAFDRIAKAMPLRIALAATDCRITYAGLDAWSDSIAAELGARGVGSGAIVGLFMPRSAAAIASILGVLKAGAAYLPFDTTYPPALLRYMAEDSEPALMLRPPAAEAAKFWDCPTLDVGAIADQRTRSRPAIRATAPDDLAYVMYTSGSSGRPKGVMIPQRGVLRLVLDNPFADLPSDEVLLQHSPLSFDASTFEIWGALLNGGRLALLPAGEGSLEDLAQAIRRQGVTTLWLTAAIFHLMVDHRLEALRPLRQLLAGGDVLSPPHVARAVAALPQTRLINGYGPTENTTFSCCYTIPADYSPQAPVPIGTAIRGTTIRVVDDAGNSGIEGELYVGGAGLALGYLRHPQLTAARFVADAFGSDPAARLYRTGDRVRIGAGGALQFLGRVDRQVKVNGKRVELDEIEACLRRSGLVADAAVVCRTTGGLRRIEAFVTPAAGAVVAIPPLRAFLRQELPDYMQPASLSMLETLPLSPAGKVDRARLPIVASTAAPGTPHAANGDIRATLLRIWSEALGTDAIGPADNFFDLGGTSLQMIEVHAAIQARLLPRATLVDLFTYPSIDTLAAWLERGATRRSIASTAPDRAARQRAALAWRPRRR